MREEGGEHREAGIELSNNEKKIERAIGRFASQEFAPVLKIICDTEPSETIIAKIREAGYDVVDVTDGAIHDPAFMERLNVIVHCQQYFSDFKRLPVGHEDLPKKIALVFHPNAYSACCGDEGFRYTWSVNINYGPDFHI